MRAIKFRGKAKDDGIWVHGDLTTGDTIHTSPSWYEDGEMEWWGYECHEATIGEYTGINDINGVEIYEGDVVRFTQEWEIGADRDKIEVVQFQHGGFTPMCRTLGGVYYECQSERYEVIGNVHDNPEMRKGGAE